jgi:hypothetical protein
MAPKNRATARLPGVRPVRVGAVAWMPFVQRRGSGSRWRVSRARERPLSGRRVLVMGASGTSRLDEARERFVLYPNFI